MRPMDLYQLLRQDHLKAKRLFERLSEVAEPATSTRERLFQELKQELERHTELEEKHFYPALERYEEAQELVGEALEEHDEIGQLIEALDQSEPDDQEWAMRLSELQEEVEFHIEEEETELFPQAQELLKASEAQAIAEAIARDKAAAKEK
jgi:iron-sulfur cluster repair protein YtfE (RIC family)